MESDKTSIRSTRCRREGKEEIGGKMLIEAVIGEVDKLQSLSDRNEQVAQAYAKLLKDTKATVVKVDTAALDTKKKEFTEALDDRIKKIRRSTGMLTSAL